MSNNIDIDIINKRVQELSFLNAGVNIEVKDERTGKSKTFKNSGGVAGYVKFLHLLSLISTLSINESKNFLFLMRE